MKSVIFELKEPLGEIGTQLIRKDMHQTTAVHGFFFRICAVEAMQNEKWYFQGGMMQAVL